MSAEKDHFMPSMSIDYDKFLTGLCYDLVDCIRYSNGFLFELLKKVTIGKSVIISLDGVKISLYATGNNGYELIVEPAVIDPDFVTTGDTLRNIVNGTITLDHALSTGAIFVKGNLEELIGIFQLTLGLLAEGAVDPHLRRLWSKFDRKWITNPSSINNTFLEEQQVYNYFPFQGIPKDVALINISVDNT